MERKDVIDFLIKVGLAMIPAIFAFIPAILNWVSSRALAKGRIGRITLLSTELKFLEQWLSLARDPDGGATPKPSSQKVRPELDKILAEYLALREHDLKRQERRPEYIRPLRKALLLFHPASPKGWALQIVFYFLAIFAVVLIVQERWGTPAGERDVQSLIVGLVIIFGPILFFVARAAVRLRNTQEKERAEANLRKAQATTSAAVSQ